MSATAVTERAPGWFAIGMERWRIEVKQFLRQRESVVFTIGLPLLLLFIFGSVFHDDITPGVTFSRYFAAGMIASGLLNSGFQALAIGVSVARDNGALKRLSGSPMPRVSYFIGKFLLVATISLLQITLLFAGGVAAYGLKLPDAQGWITFAWLWLLGGVTCALLGIAFSSVIRDGESSPAIVTPVVLVLQFTGGVFFQYSQLPSWMQHLAAIFPLKWLTQGMRSVFLPDSFQSQEPAGSWELGRVALVLVAWAVVGLVLCLKTFRWQRRGEN